MRNLFLMPNRFKIETLLFDIASTPPPKTAVSAVCSTTLARTPTWSRRSWTTMALPGSSSSLLETSNPAKNSNSITEITVPPHILQNRGWRTDNWVNEVQKLFSVFWHFYSLFYLSYLFCFLWLLYLYLVAE